MNSRTSLKEAAVQTTSWFYTVIHLLVVDVVVLLVNVGPETYGNLSDICQKSVRKLSVTKMCWKTVLNVSEFYQKTVRCKYLSELYQKRFRNASEMCQILKICQKTVSALFRKLFEMCQKCHF